MSPQLREGFAGQDMFVIPRPILGDARRHPLVRSLYPTDIGWYPKARYHYRERENGAPEDHLMLCIGGHGRVVVNDQENHLQSGQMLIIPRHCRHKYWAEDDEPWSIYWMHFRGEDSEYYVERVPGNAAPAPIDEPTMNEAMRLFRDCLDALETGGYALPTLIYAAQSARHILSLLLFRNALLPIEQKREDRRAQCHRIIDFMRSNLDQQMRLEDFAAEAGMSVSHFSEMFREQTHHSPMSYFTHLRIRAACRMLDLTEKPIKVVSMETGYSDPYYFSRVFRKVMGLSPARYRQIKKG